MMKKSLFKHDDIINCDTFVSSRTNQCFIQKYTLIWVLLSKSKIYLKKLWNNIHHILHFINVASLESSETGLWRLWCRFVAFSLCLSVWSCRKTLGLCLDSFLVVSSCGAVRVSPSLAFNMDSLWRQPQNCPGCFIVSPCNPSKISGVASQYFLWCMFVISSFVRWFLKWHKYMVRDAPVKVLW